MGELGYGQSAVLLGATGNKWIEASEEVETEDWDRVDAELTEVELPIPASRTQPRLAASSTQQRSASQLPTQPNRNRPRVLSATTGRPHMSTLPSRVAVAVRAASEVRDAANQQSNQLVPATSDADRSCDDHCKQELSVDASQR